MRLLIHFLQHHRLLFRPSQDFFWVHSTFWDSNIGLKWKYLMLNNSYTSFSIHYSWYTWNITIFSILLPRMPRVVRHRLLLVLRISLPWIWRSVLQFVLVLPSAQWWCNCIYNAMHLVKFLSWYKSVLTQHHSDDCVSLLMVSAPLWNQTCFPDS